MRRQPSFTLLGLALFLVLFVILTLQAVAHLRDRPFDPSLTALLPVTLTETGDPQLEEALHRTLSGKEGRNLTLLVGVSSPDLTSRARLDLAAEAADSVEKALLNTGFLTLIKPSPSTLDAFRPAAGRLLSDERRTALAETLRRADSDQQLFHDALANLNNPAAPKLMGFQRDPLGLFESWLAERQQSSGLLTVMGPHGPLSLVAHDDPETTTVVLSVTVANGIAESGKGMIAAALQTIKEQVTSSFTARHPHARFTLTATGVPLFTDVIASAAQSELTLIGTVSGIGVLTFALLLFGRPLTVLTMILTVAVGFWTGLSCAMGAFGTLSLITFVFGATLIGVTVDYSAHWFSAFSDPTGSRDPWQTQKHLFPTLMLAALSTAVAYGLLAAAPLPGLRQMAVFASAGVIGAFLTVVLLLPFLSRYRWVRPTPTSLMLFLSRRLPRFPRLNKQRWTTPAGFGGTVLFVLFLAGGLWQVTPGTGVRDLQGLPPALMAEQTTIARKLSLPSPAQVFLIEGKTLDEVLMQEEALKFELAEFRRFHREFSKLRPVGLTDWMQSHEKRLDDLELTSRAIRRLRPALNELLGAEPLMPGDAPVTVEMLRNSPARDFLEQTLLIHEPERTATVLYLSGLQPEALPYLHRIAGEFAGVTFVDITGDITQTLSVYRNRVMGLLVLGFVLLFFLLKLPYGKDAWRSLLPAALGILSAIAVLGWCGIPFTLFSALACILLLGLGVDCGIFLSSAPTDGRAWTAVFFSGVTTMLSFGLLAFSSTPALTAFGLTVLTGQLGIWLIAPLVRPKNRIQRSG